MVDRPNQDEFSSWLLPFKVYDEAPVFEHVIHT